MTTAIIQTYARSSARVPIKKRKLDSVTRVRTEQEIRMLSQPGRYNPFGLWDVTHKVRVYL